ncbi:hypothetical protein B0O99DRAFT_684658 [Bisporella sp. PMI_857]|nr:hypothetical protein B0O99DRAFT_684658 [Bisporella sp. PMI_857]
MEIRTCLGKCNAYYLVRKGVPVATLVAVVSRSHEDSADVTSPPTIVIVALTVLVPLFEALQLSYGLPVVFNSAPVVVLDSPPSQSTRLSTHHSNSLHQIIIGLGLGSK